MARFFNTADRQFVEDYIFDPNVELIADLATKKDDDITQGLAQLEILGNPIFKYNKDADSEYAKEVKDKWENIINSEAENIQKNILDTAGMKRRLAALNKELQNDYEFGDINKLQRNYENIEKWTAGLEKLETGDIDRYKTILKDYFGKAGGRGAANGLFEGPEHFASKGYYLDDFLQSSSFKELVPEEVESIREGVNGGWIVSNGKSTVTLDGKTIQDAYKRFAESNPNVMGRAKVGQDWFGERWLDKDGNLSFEEGTVLGDEFKSAALYKTKKEKTTRNIRETYEYQQQLQQQYSKTEEEQLAFVGVDTTEFIKQNKYATDVAKNIYDTTKEDILKARLASRPQSEHQKIRDYFDKRIRNMNELYNYVTDGRFGTTGSTYNNLKKIVGDRMRQVESLRTASFEPLTQLGYSNTEIKQLQKDLDSHVSRYYGSMTYYVSTAEGEKPGESGNKAFFEQFKNGFKPQTIINTEVTLPNGERGKVASIKVIDGSVLPIVVNSRQGTGTSLRQNMATNTFEVEYYPKEGSGYAEKPVKVDMRAFFDMAQGPNLGID